MPNLPKVTSVVCAVVLLAIAHPARAIPVTGNLNIFGNLSLTSAAVTFVPAGQFLVGSGNGTFVALDLTTGIALGIPIASGPVSVPNFLTLAALPGLVTALTSLDAGVFSTAACGTAPAAGQTCTPSGSILSLVNTTADSSILSFTVRGNWTIDGVETSNFLGTYTTQFSSHSYQEVLAALASVGFVTGAYSANFTTTEVPAAVPEPATLLLLGSSLAGSGLAVWRRRRSPASTA